MARVSGKLIRWTVFAICFFGTIELACRIEQWWLDSAAIFGVHTYDTALFTMDEYGITGKPNGTYEKWRLNAKGFRGPEIQTEKLDGRLRIVCIGASETFGLYENPENEWPRQLERHLAGVNADVEVINAAIAGMSLSQRTQHLRQRLLPLHPDVVVMMLEYGSYAGLTPEKVRVRAANRSVLPDRTGVIERIKALRAPNRLKEVVLPRLPRSVQEAVEELEKGIKLEIRKVELGGNFRLFKHVTALEGDTFRRDLQELLDTSTAAGVPLVMLSPAMWLSENNLSRMYLSWPYIDEMWWRESRLELVKIAREFADANHVEFLDLSQIVEGHEDRLMKDMLHFNDDGAAQVANQVAHIVLDGRFGLMVHH